MLIPIILSGGAGARLWPISRKLHPKPFIRLADGRSLLQKAFLRAAELPEVKEILTVTNRELLFKTQEEYEEINQSHIATPFILEPIARNTAAAIAAAALYIKDLYGPKAVMLVLAADHLVENQIAFNSAVAEAIAFAEQGKLVTFGITPHSPETGYGYIEAEANKVLQFIEKPSLQKAQEYLRLGRFLWNSGIFCFTATSLLREMQEYCPEMLSLVTSCIEKSCIKKQKSYAQVELEELSFSSIPDISIDYALMEKSKQVCVVPCDIGWNDIGSWNAISDLLEPDANGNRVVGDSLLQDVHNSFIQAQGRLVAAVGVEDLIIVDTTDAILITHKSRSQDVKGIYGELNSRNHETHKLHRTVHRPWGNYTILEQADNFKIKRIIVKPGASLSLQQHQHRSEHWVVVSGVAKVTNGNKHILVNVNESTYIPAGQKHRLENPGTDNLIMIEVQSGSYVGEDDIVRFEDAYGRAEEVV